MRLPSFPASLALLSVAALSGCTYVHLGKLPASAMGPAALVQENEDLTQQKEKLQRELVLAKQEGDSLRAMLKARGEERVPSAESAAQLSVATRELAALRANYAKLQAESRLAAPDAGPQVADLKAKLGDTEDKLAMALRTYTQLQGETGQLRSDLEKTRAENLTLATQVRDLSDQAKATQTVVAQLNSELVAQKESRTKVEQEAETLRSQLTSANERAASFAAGLRAAGAAGGGEPTATLRTNPARLAAGDKPADSGTEVAALTSQLDALRAKVESLEAERAALQRQLAAAPTGENGPKPESADQAAAEAKLAVALRSYTLLRDENDQLKASAEKISEEKSQLAAQLAVTKSAVPVAAQAGALREQLRQTQAQVGALAAENAQLRSRVGAAAPVAATPARPGPAAAAAPAAVPTRTAAVGAPAPKPVTPAPAAAVAPAAGHTHVVVAGDTLAKISQKYYGTASRWAEIRAANRAVMRDEQSLVVGSVLQIP
jgi:LysM repeat protein